MIIWKLMQIKLTFQRLSVTVNQDIFLSTSYGSSIIQQPNHWWWMLVKKKTKKLRQIFWFAYKLSFVPWDHVCLQFFLWSADCTFYGRTATFENLTPKSNFSWKTWRSYSFFLYFSFSIPSFFASFYFSYENV